MSGVITSYLHFYTQTDLFKVYKIMQTISQQTHVDVNNNLSPTDSLLLSGP